jgi:hypothetical protein
VSDLKDKRVGVSRLGRYARDGGQRIGFPALLLGKDERHDMRAAVGKC